MADPRIQQTQMMTSAVFSEMKQAHSLDNTLLPSFNDCLFISYLIFFYGSQVDEVLPSTDQATRQPSLIWRWCRGQQVN